MTQLIDYLKDNGISEHDIGVMYADDNDDKNFSDELVKRKAAIYQSLKDEEMLPSDIKLFIATTKCKEGINIMDEDISIMLSENHYFIDLIQMAGRVRKGLNTLYVIYDAQHNYDSFSRFDVDKACRKHVPVYQIQPHHTSFRDIRGENQWHIGLLQQHKRLCLLR